MGEAVAYKNAMLESFLLHAYVLYAGLSVKRQKKATYLHLVLDAAHTNLIGPLSGRGNSPKLPLDSEALYGIGGELQRLYKRGQ
jgi:hypothetical protein